LLLALLLLAGCRGGFRRVPDFGVDGGSGAQLEFVIPDSPDAGALRGVWGTGDDVYAVGENGVAHHFAGAVLTASVVLGAGNDMYGVWGSGPTDVWAVGTQRATLAGIMYHRTGENWVQFARPRFGLRSVWGVGDMRYASGLSGVIYSGPTAMPFANGVQADPNPNVAVTPNAPILYSISGNSENAVLAAGDLNIFYFWDGTWHGFSDPTDRTRAYRAVFGAPSTETVIYQGANYFGLWLFRSSSEPMLQLNEERDRLETAERSLWGIWGTSNERIIAVGDEGRIITYDRSTQVVRSHASPTNKSLYAIWGSSENDVWIVGEAGLILRGKINF
jgi:hypothetical protein